MRALKVMRNSEESLTMFKWRAALAALATCGAAMLAPTAAWAEPSIKSISSSQLVTASKVSVNRCFIGDRESELFST